MTDNDKKLFTKGIDSVQHRFTCNQSNATSPKNEKQNKSAMYNYLRKLGMNEIDAKQRVSDIFNVIKESANIGEDTIKPQLFDQVTSQRQHDLKYPYAYQRSQAQAQFTLSPANSAKSIPSPSYVDVSYDCSKRNSTSQFDYSYNSTLRKNRLSAPGNINDRNINSYAGSTSSKGNDNVNTVRETNNGKQSGSDSIEGDVKHNCSVTSNYNEKENQATIIYDEGDAIDSIVTGIFDQLENAQRCKCCIIL